MSRTTDFLPSLTDTELAFLFVFKRNGYLPEQQLKVDRELELRNMSPERVAAMVASLQFDTSNTGCLRCNSRRQLADGACAVCGWDEGREPYPRPPWWKNVADFFGFIFHALSH